ncbi:MAG: acetolactate synthase small subunit [Chthoniobacterales bacterium]
MRYTLSILVENQFGVLARIAGMFSGRGFNIDTLNVAPALDLKTSRLTIVFHGNHQILEQVRKQVSKLINVLSVEELSEENSLARELLLIRIQADAVHQNAIIALCAQFDAHVMEQYATTITIQIANTEKKIHHFLELLQPFKIVDLRRTGKVALALTTS